ncbi:serine/threonine-protein phosphatase 6 regulatory subunit 3 [Copidosoma floridanum]|uniref:serine/threonine-protein phosphatase 6 regulatory subunit 3 n=1 Tax=Copidosoma floridanum TaxID=29053 RepID=UPI0006C99B8C|nr:serine/threonine-protein phosphatase 6 regulatory subunit 3 [Copidosoma floridanum]
MDAEDILQECKSQNKKLLEYLTRSTTLEELVNLITEEPSMDLEERWRYKYSNVACELLTSDVPVLTEKLASNEILLSKLYSFIDKEEPLNPLLASFFSKTIHSLLRRASDQNWISHQFVCLQVLESLKSRKNCVDLLLQHIQTSAIMDLILILLTKIEGDEMRQNVLNWFDDQQFVQRLVKLLSSSSDKKKHANASQLLCDIIKLPHIEPEKRPDLMLRTLQSEETIKLLLETILSGEKVESSIVGGVRILINVIGKKVSSFIDSSDSYGVSYSNIVEDELRNELALIVIPYLRYFNQLLTEPPQMNVVKTTAGFIEKPFGRTRLYILKLYVSLLSTENGQVLEKFVESDTFEILLDLFFHFAWNNFLHTQVQQCLISAVSSEYSRINKSIYHNIFIKSMYIDRILDAWKTESICILNNQNKVRPGYMGHLVVMANEIVKQCEECNVLSDYLKKNLPEENMQKWELFVSSQLDEINKKQQIVLGEPLESYTMPCSGSTDQYTAFPQDSYCQELCSNYVEQEIVSAYDNANSNSQGDELNNINKIFYNSSEALIQQNLSVTNIDYKRSLELFDEVCDNKMADNGSQSDKWQNNDFQLRSSNWLSGKKNSSSSSDEEEGEDKSNKNFNERSNDSDAKIKDPWNTVKMLQSSSMTPINLWNEEIPQPVEQTGWANFDDFSDTTTADVSKE